MNGNVIYSGVFHKGMREGLGISFHANIKNRILYEGHYINDMRESVIDTDGFAVPGVVYKYKTTSFEEKGKAMKSIWRQRASSAV